MHPEIPQAGSLFILLAFFHVAAELILQTDKDVREKADCWKTNLAVSTLYAVVGFGPALYMLGYSLPQWLASIVILLGSHFIIATLEPTYLWAKYVRKVPGIRLDGRAAFKSMTDKPHGRLLLSGVDQFQHLSVLWAVVALA